MLCVVGARSANSLPTVCAARSPLTHLHQSPYTLPSPYPTRAVVNSPARSNMQTAMQKPRAARPAALAPRALFGKLKAAKPAPVVEAEKPKQRAGLFQFGGGAKPQPKPQQQKQQQAAKPASDKADGLK